MQEFLKEIEGLEFFSIEDLFEKREYVRERFRELDPDVKRIYKWYYFYQLCILDDNLKSTMWDYLNDIGDELPMRLAYLDYKLRKERYLKIYAKKEED